MIGYRLKIQLDKLEVNQLNFDDMYQEYRIKLTKTLKGFNDKDEELEKIKKFIDSQDTNTYY